MANQYTIMTVHAHPDDEVVFTGGTLALYGERGAITVLVTATNGEEGEIHDPDLDPDEARPRLGEIRRVELERAVEALGITHFEPLDYRDSGMVGTEANAHPANFHNADKEEATARLVALVRKYKPQVLITYDENGAYGHPDHIAANVITEAAYERAADSTYRPELGEPWQVLKLYYTHWPEENWKRAREMAKARGFKWPGQDEEEEANQEQQPVAAEGEEGVLEREAEQAEAREEAAEEGKQPAYVPPPITTRIDVSSAFSKKTDGIKAHRTQFDPSGLFTEMPEDIARIAFGEEDYSLVKSRVGAAEQETDVLAGLT